jgi:ferric-dicitrate binding protein FerR (iron transport regulator)
MSNLYSKYEQYDVLKFGLDDDFIDWVKNPTPQNDLFWQGMMAENPEQVENIELARKLILSLDTTREKAPEEVKERIWQRVKDQNPGGRIIKFKRFRFWLAAASVLLVLLAAGWFLLKHPSGSKQLAINKTKSAHQDILPGGNRAILTLSNGSSIQLDTASNGTLAREGSSRVIKLADGRLAYEGANIKSIEVQYNTVATPRGGQYQLTLADGSKVWLNAASSISFPTAFTENERKVIITGEAYFEVAHNAEKPFIVQINSALGNGAHVAVLGTHFNINAYDDEHVIRTTLLEGSVKVSNSNTATVIAPGQQASLPDMSGNIQVANNVDVDQVVAWKNGFFQFQNYTIKDIMRQLSRWYDVEVEYRGKIPEGHYVGKPSRNLKLSEILKVIEYSGVKLDVEGNKIIVSE